MVISPIEDASLLILNFSNFELSERKQKTHQDFVQKISGIQTDTIVINSYFNPGSSSHLLSLFDIYISKAAN